MTTGAIASRKDNPAERMCAIIQGPAVVQTLMRVLPKNLPPERLIRQAVTLIRTTPDLALCPPESVLIGIARAAELSLELSGPLGHAYLIPRWNGKKKCKEAVFQLGIKGYKLLAYRAGAVLMIRDGAVWPGDDFDYRYGTGQFLRHKPCGKEEGEPTHFYAWAQLRGGVEDFHVMTTDSVKAWRERYSPPPQAGKADYSAWATNFNGMARKTVVGVLARRMPLTSGAAELMDAGGDEADPLSLRSLPIPQAAPELLAAADFTPEPASDGPPPVADESAEQPA